MRALCVTLALVTLATLPAQARGSSRFFFPSARTSTSARKAWFLPAPRVQVYVVKYVTVWQHGYKMRLPYLTPKMHCYSATLCVPVFKKVTR